MIRGETVIKKTVNGDKLSPSIPVGFASSCTSIAESIRGYPFEGKSQPFHDHAYYGVRIPRGASVSIDNGTPSAAASFTVSTGGDWYGLNPDCSTSTGITTFTTSAPIIPSVPTGPILSLYSVAGLTKQTSSSVDPALIGKALVSRTGSGNCKFRLYNRQKQVFVDSPVFSSSTQAWIDIPAITIGSGLTYFELFFLSDTALDKVELWSMILTETTTDTRPAIDGFYIYGLDPRP